MTRSSRIPGFYTRPVDERRRTIAELADCDLTELTRALSDGGLDVTTADKRVLSRGRRLRPTVSAKRWRKPTLAVTRIMAIPCRAPQITKFQLAPCQKPLTRNTMKRFKYLRGRGT